MMLFCASNVLFLLAFLALRCQQRDAPRPFRVPGGGAAAAAYCTPPMLICVANFGLTLNPQGVEPAGIALRVGVCVLVLAAAAHQALAVARRR